MDPQLCFSLPVIFCLLGVLDIYIWLSESACQFLQENPLTFVKPLIFKKINNPCLSSMSEDSKYGLAWFSSLFCTFQLTFYDSINFSHAFGLKADYNITNLYQDWTASVTCCIPLLGYNILTVVRESTSPVVPWGRKKEE